MKAINKYLINNSLLIADNPCISPDFCLNWERLETDIRTGNGILEFPRSQFETADGTWRLLRNSKSDYAWKLVPLVPGAGMDILESGEAHAGAVYFPCSYENLLRLKNRVQEHDPKSTIFPTAGGDLGRRTLGIGARFTSLHWPGVDWAMARLGIGLTANQNSIPRELVFDVEAMLAGKLDKVAFPFIGAEVPEGHQGQSVEGMGHGCILSKLMTGFHKHRIEWSFNADHQPVGGKYDDREDQLVAGCLLASYITFDLSPELALTNVPESVTSRRTYVNEQISPEVVEAVSSRVSRAGLDVSLEDLDALLCYVWPAMVKMKQRDEKYRSAREAAFSTSVGRHYLRELSIDELPGITQPETTAVMLSLTEALGMPVNFIAPAFGFQKNAPYADNQKLRHLIESQWTICRDFGVSIGFHSGSGKSAENYQVMGSVTNGNLEIKTSGRYTYEMGMALFKSDDPADQQLWEDWYGFTRSMALAGAFSNNTAEREMAREFIRETLRHEGRNDEYETATECGKILQSLLPHPDHMIWFEYNFLYVLAEEGKPDEKALGSHTPAGYRQRARFYSISDFGRLEFAKRVAGYILFLAETTGIADGSACEQARARLETITSYSDFLDDIGSPSKD